jgi:hypothetical protein
MGRKGVWGGREYGAQGGLGRTGELQYGAEASLGRNLGAWAEGGLDHQENRKSIIGRDHLKCTQRSVTASLYKPAGRSAEDRTRSDR